MREPRFVLRKTLGEDRLHFGAAFLDLLDSEDAAVVALGVRAAGPIGVVRADRHVDQLVAEGYRHHLRRGAARGRRARRSFGRGNRRDAAPLRDD